MHNIIYNYLIYFHNSIMFRIRWIHNDLNSVIDPPDIIRQNTAVYYLEISDISYCIWTPCKMNFHYFGGGRLLALQEISPGQTSYAMDMYFQGQWGQRSGLVPVASAVFSISIYFLPDCEQTGHRSVVKLSTVVFSTLEQKNNKISISGSWRIANNEK